MTDIVTEDSEDSESRAMLITVFDVWPALSVILYILVFGAGVGTIPWLLLGELCPSKVKGVASGVTVAVAFICIFAVVKLFPFGLKYLTPSGTYAFFALVILNQIRKLTYHICIFLQLQVSIAMAIFTVLFVPETKGKSLQEIQTIFGELEPKPAQIDTISGDMVKS